MDTEKPGLINPWVPMSDPCDLKHLGKLAEELGECQAAVSRCIIQGINESEPVSGKPNRQWLEDELADVLANVGLVIERFGLNLPRIARRRERKEGDLKRWHDGLEVSAPACLKCGRVVKSPCNDAEGYFTNGPWDYACRDWFQPGAPE